MGSVGLQCVGYHFYLHLTGVQVVSLPYLLFILLCYFIIIICFNSLYSILFVYLLAFPRVLPWESLDVRCTWHTKMPWWSIAPEATAFKHRDLMKNVFLGTIWAVEYFILRAGLVENMRLFYNYLKLCCTMWWYPCRPWERVLSKGFEETDVAPWNIWMRILLPIEKVNSKTGSISWNDVAIKKQSIEEKLTLGYREAFYPSEVPINSF